MSQSLLSGLPSWKNSLAFVAISPFCRPSVPGFTCTEVGVMSAGAWTAVYRMAYEQARIALEPSFFQKQLAPSRN
jgi:hypothetical protein